MAIEDYEEFKYCSIANWTGGGWSAPLLTADYGGGYEVGAVAAPYGLRRWALTANVSPDTENYTVTHNEITETRFRYYWHFYQRHLLAGNKPFILREPETGKRYLAQFEDTTLTFERLSYKMYGGNGVTVREARRSDVSFNADGSIGESVIGAGVVTEDGFPVTEDGFLVTL